MYIYIYMHTNYDNIGLQAKGMVGDSMFILHTKIMYMK